MMISTIQRYQLRIQIAIYIRSRRQGGHPDRLRWSVVPDRETPRASRSIAIAAAPKRATRAAVLAASLARSIITANASGAAARRRGRGRIASQASRYSRRGRRAELSSLQRPNGVARQQRKLRRCQEADLVRGPKATIRFPVLQRKPTEQPPDHSVALHPTAISSGYEA